MDTLGTRLRQARKKKKISQKALAELIGIKQQAVQRIERGDVKNTSYIVELARALDVSADWLSTGKEWQPPLVYSSELATRCTHGTVNHAPVLSWDDMDEILNLPLKTTEHRRIPIFNHPGENCFALEVNDDSMQNDQPDGLTFLKNDLIFVEVGCELKPDNFIIAKLPNLKSVVFRRYIIHEAIPSLEALNKNYPSMKLTPDIQIIGTVFMRYTKLT